MALEQYSNKIRPPVMQVYLLKTGVVDIDDLIANDSITLNSVSVSHIYDIDKDLHFTTDDGFEFSNKRLKSVKLPKQGIPTQKDPYLGYDGEGIQQYDLIVSDDPDTMISWNCKMDGSEHEQIYPAANDDLPTSGSFGEIAKRAGIRVGQDIIKKDVLVVMDGSVGNVGGKKIAHFFKDVALTFTPDEGSADNKEDIKGTYEGSAEKYWIEKEQ